MSLLKFFFSITSKPKFYTMTPVKCTTAKSLDQGFLLLIFVKLFYLASFGTQKVVLKKEEKYLEKWFFMFGSIVENIKSN